MKLIFQQVDVRMKRKNHHHLDVLVTWAACLKQMAESNGRHRPTKKRQTAVWVKCDIPKEKDLIL